MSESILAEITPSPPRRFVGLGILWVLAAILIGLAIKHETEAGTSLFLVGFAAFTMFWAEAVRRATRTHLYLTEEHLRDSRGRVLARFEDMVKVDRGTFAFKPSNGFVLVLSVKPPAIWAPGLYWRLGRRIGVGGVTSAAQTKTMAEIIAFRIAQREMDAAAKREAEEG
ncbi:hypothetical protein IV417_15490 [Alphaproteobacteria bacterium KMM 3653]|uniref:Uncharacterized protein n=1 Tax=Harenicola maris TaxID=2841044 RepID=A0AAP2CQQ6_9RHOB|nr:hypothetical protein [Harenicola maris]